MTRGELDRWLVILRVLRERGHFSLSDRELPGLGELIEAAGGKPPKPDPPRFVREPPPPPTDPAKCDCRAKLAAMHCSAARLEGQIARMMKAGPDESGL